MFGGGSTGAPGSSTTSPNRLTPRSNPAAAANPQNLTGAAPHPLFGTSGKKKKGLKIDCTQMSKVQNKNWRMDNMRLGDLQGMQYLINQLKKYRINEGTGVYLLSSSMYTGIGGYSTSFLSPANLNNAPTSNTLGTAGSGPS